MSETQEKQEQLSLGTVVLLAILTILCGVCGIWLLVLGNEFAYLFIFPIGMLAYYIVQQCQLIIQSDKEDTAAAHIAGPNPDSQDVSTANKMYDPELQPSARAPEVEGARDVLLSDTLMDDR